MKQEQEIFEQAIALPSREAREGFLLGACGQNRELRKSVDELLAAFNDAGELDFLQTGDRSQEAQTVLADPQLHEKAGDRIGRYKLLQQIGEGGCGVVYMAEQEEPVRRRVALKVIKLGMDTKSVIARFEAERQALALMDHPNIAKVLDAGATDAGRPYFVMELVRGIKITEYCDETKLSTRERLDLFIKVCQAIQHAHQKGIIHRDIKPSNILVTINDGVAVPKVIDFGIAKATEGRLTDKTLFTQFEALIGTPAYMSPEQAVMTSLDIDTRSDIYSLGVLLYELLAGSTPFDAKELMALGIDEMRKTIREKEPLRPSTKLSQTLVGADVRRLSSKSEIRNQKSEIDPASSRRLLQVRETIALLRGDLDWIVMKCLEKDRARRYETANGLASDIQRHLNNEAVLARPPSAAYRFQKLVRRNKLVFAAASAVTLTLIAGLSFSTWAFLRERKAHAGEAAQRRTAVEQQRKAEAAQASEAEQRRKADAEKVTAQRHLYVANLNLAQQAWDENNAGRVRRLLEETATHPDLGFEWYYLQRQLHRELRTLRGHTAQVWAVAFSPDGRRFVTGSEDQTAQVWDAVSGQALHSLKEHRGGVTSAAFSPDGLSIVTGSQDWTGKVWAAASDNALLTLKGHSNEIWSVAFSPDGQRIITGSRDKTAKVWEAANGNALLSLTGHSDVIWSVAFSPDGRRIVTGSRDGTAKVWEAVSGNLLRSIEGDSGSINAVAFSPDGQRIVTGSQVHTAKVWEAATGNLLFTLKGHSHLITSVAFSQDGQRIVTGSFDQTAKVWEAANGQERLTLKGHGGMIRSVAFSPDGQRIATGSHDQTAKMWEAVSDQERLTFKGHSGVIRSVAFSPDGQRIATGSEDKTARVWDAANGQERLTLKGHSSGIHSVAFSPDGQWIVSGSFDQTARVWEATSGQELHTLQGHSGGINSVAFSPDGQRIVTGSADKTARVWLAVGGKELLPRLQGHSGGINSVAFSPDGQRIITGSEDQTARVWEAVSGRELLPSLTGHSGGINEVAFSLDGQRIVTSSMDQTVKVWEAASGKLLLTLDGHRSRIESVAFSPDGKRIVTGSDDQTVRLWELASGKELLTLKGRAGITSVAYSPDGQRIVACDWGAMASIWEAATPQQVAAWQQREKAAEAHLEVRAHKPKLKK